MSMSRFIQSASLLHPFPIRQASLFKAKFFSSSAKPPGFMRGPENLLLAAQSLVEGSEALRLSMRSLTGRRAALSSTSEALSDLRALLKGVILASTLVSNLALALPTLSSGASSSQQASAQDGLKEAYSAAWAALSDGIEALRYVATAGADLPGSSELDLERGLQTVAARSTDLLVTAEDGGGVLAGLQQLFSVTQCSVGALLASRPLLEVSVDSGGGNPRQPEADSKAFTPLSRVLPKSAATAKMPRPSRQEARAAAERFASAAPTPAEKEAARLERERVAAEAAAARKLQRALFLGFVYAADSKGMLAGWIGRVRDRIAERRESEEEARRAMEEARLREEELRLRAENCNAWERDLVKLELTARDKTFTASNCPYCPVTAPEAAAPSGSKKGKRSRGKGRLNPDAASFQPAAAAVQHVAEHMESEAHRSAVDSFGRFADALRTPGALLESLNGASRLWEETQGDLEVRDVPERTALKGSLNKAKKASIWLRVP